MGNNIITSKIHTYGLKEKKTTFILCKNKIRWIELDIALVQAYFLH